MKLGIGFIKKTVVINSSSRLLWLLVSIELLTLPHILYVQTMIVCGGFFYSIKYWIEQFEVPPCPTRSIRRRPCGALILTSLFLLRVLGWCVPGISGVGRSSLLAERSSFSLVSCSAFIVFVSARFASGCFLTFQLLPANNRVSWKMGTEPKMRTNGFF